MAQPLWKTVCQFLKNLIISLLYNSATELLSIFPKEMKIYLHTKTCIWMFTAALFYTTITKKLEQSKCPLYTNVVYPYDGILLSNKKRNKIQMVPDMMFDLWFFDFTVVQNWYVFCRNHTSNFEFWPFPGLVICNMILFHDAGQWQRPQLLVNHVIVGVNNKYTYNCSGPRQPFCFSLSAQYSLNYMRYSTLYYKIGLVLDYFAQLLVNMCSEHV